MDDKTLNPIYSWIVESVLTEQEIAKEKVDLYSFSLSLACDFLFSKKLLSEFAAFLEKNISARKFSLRDVVPMAVSLCLKEKDGISLDKKFIEQALNCIGNLADKNIPLGMKIMTFYFAKQYNNIKLEGLKALLIDKQREFKEQRSLDNLIEVEFALGTEHFSEEIWKDFDSDTSAFEINKLSKLAILLKQNGKNELAEKCIKRIEKKTREKISSSSLPVISLLIYEAEKLISTNLSSEKLNEILDSLKRKNTAWAKLISEIQDKGITLDLKRLNRISGLNIEDSCWALFTLEAFGRKETYQMSTQDKENLNKYNELIKDGIILIPSKAVRSYFLYTVLLTMLGFLYLNLTGFQQLKSIYLNIQSISGVRIVPELLGDFWSLPVVTIIFVKYYFYSWRYLVTKKNFDLKALASSIIAIRPAG